MERRRIYLLRHADVSYFEKDGTPVKPQTVQLTDQGREQAEAAFRALLKARFDRVVTSGLPRTVETARIVMGNRELRVEKEPAFEEIRPGRLSEIPREEAERAFTRAFTPDPRSRFLNGETFESLERRVLPAWDRLIFEPGWGGLLLVAHGGVNRVILSRALGAGREVYPRIEQDACCINVIDVDVSEGTPGEPRYIVRAINLTPYNMMKEGIVDTTMEALWKKFTGAGSE